MLIDTINNAVLLAAGGQQQAKDFFTGNDFGQVLATLMGIAGIVLILFGVVRAIAKVAQGKVSDAVKVLLLSAGFAVFLIQPQLIGSLIDSLTGAVEAILSGFQQEAG